MSLTIGENLSGGNVGLYAAAQILVVTVSSTNLTVTGQGRQLLVPLPDENSEYRLTFRALFQVFLLPVGELKAPAGNLGLRFVKKPKRLEMDR